MLQLHPVDYLDQRPAHAAAIPPDIAYRGANSGFQALGLLASSSIR